MIHRPPKSFDFPRRLLATGCAALVVFLGLMSASPTLHAWVHGAHDQQAAHAASPTLHDPGCVVVWFALGVSLAADTAVVATTAQVWRELPLLAADELLLATPHYWHRPGRAPPFCLS